ncbi:MAG: AMP-binding protein, partial [Solirubrobacterales bacterium]
MTAYMRWLDANRGIDVGTYDELWHWSVDSLEDFWRSIWDYFDVQASREDQGAAEEPPFDQVLGERTMPGARWFEGAALNYAEHVFRGKGEDEVAVLHASESRPLAEVTWGELRGEVAEVAEGLRALGVARGDRVVAYLPNSLEALTAFLAAASLGATWSSCSPDFGPGSVVDRFAQIEPKVMFTVDGYRYGGRDFDRLDTVAEIAARIPSLERIVVVPYLSASPDLSVLEVTDSDPAPESAPPMTWDQLTGLGRDGGADAATLRFERVPFDHPLWVLDSSGTTGLPKAIVQGHGGILLEHLKKLNLHVDAQPGDRLFWFTTTGWMMWN